MKLQAQEKKQIKCTGYYSFKLELYIDIISLRIDGIENFMKNEAVFKETYRYCPDSSDKIIPAIQLTHTEIFANKNYKKAFFA